MSDNFYCWPDWMPKAQKSNYEYEPTDRRTKTEMEVGSIVRVNYDTDETTLDCSLILNAVQSQWFEKFEKSMLNQGAKWFQMPIQIAGCIERHTVRFASRPKAGSLIGATHTTYTFRLDIEKRKLYLCDEIVSLLLCITPKELVSTPRNLRDFWISLRKLQKPDWIVDYVNTD